MKTVETISITPHPDAERLAVLRRRVEQSMAEVDARLEALFAPFDGGL